MPNHIDIYTKYMDWDVLKKITNFKVTTQFEPRAATWHVICNIINTTMQYNL